MAYPFRDEYVCIVTVDFTKQHRTPTNEFFLEELQETVNAIVPISRVLESLLP